MPLCLHLFLWRPSLHIWEEKKVDNIYSGLIFYGTINHYRKSTEMETFSLCWFFLLGTQEGPLSRSISILLESCNSSCQWLVGGYYLSSLRLGSHTLFCVFHHLSLVPWSWQPHFIGEVTRKSIAQTKLDSPWLINISLFCYVAEMSGLICYCSIS